MESNIVYHHNDFNSINLSGFDRKELDLFISIIFTIKDTGNNKVSIKIPKLIDLAHENKNPKRIKKRLETTYNKLLQIPVNYSTNNVLGGFSFFTNYEINIDTNILELQVHEKALHLINNLLDNYTKYDLMEFTSLKSGYSKLLFKLLKQYDYRKKMEISLSEFKNYLGISDSYKMGNIDQKILNPCLNELEKFFPNLECSKLKNGKAVDGFLFTWKVKKKEEIKQLNFELPKKLKNNIEIIVSQNMNKSIEETKKNRYILKYMTAKYIEKLLEEFTEDELIKGLKYCYKTINKEIKSINYLKKAIKTANEEPERIIVVKVEEEKETKEITIEDIKENKVEQACFKTKVTQEEYEKLYKTYLKQNNSNNNKAIRIAFDMMNRNKIEIVEAKRVYTVEDIEPEQLLSKTGKPLLGGALQMRVRKILSELNTEN